MAPKLTAISVARYHADAKEQRKRSLKVGGTVTIVYVTDGTKERYFEAYGATAAGRLKAAKEAFIRGEGALNVVEENVKLWFGFS